MTPILDKAMTAGQPKAKDAAGKGSPMNTDQLAEWYLQQSMEFEHSKTEAARESKKNAWRVAAGAMALAGLSIIAAGVNLFVNKPNPPSVWSHNAVTGEIVQLKTLQDGKISFGKATDLFYLRQYIHYRESYDWELIQSFYDATRLLSSPQEADFYRKFVDPVNPKSPVNVLKNNYRVIATAGTISFVGDTALVSFSKKTIPLNGNNKPTVEYFQATVSFEYEDAPMTDQDRGINVPGFRVTSYSVERDITKSTAVASETIGGIDQ
jgi:type IV secretion system protein VirB8